MMRRSRRAAVAWRAVVTAVLLLVAVGPVAALGDTSTSTTASVSVGPAANSAFAVSITSATFSTVTYRPGSGSQTATGSIVVTVTDTRSGSPGWTVTLAASGDLRSGSSAIPVGNLAFLQGTVQGQDGASTNGLSRSGLTMSTQPQRILSAPARAGTGTFDYSMPGTIRVPDGTLAGTYTTTLTVTLTSSS